MKVGFDIQFAMTRVRTGLYNHMTGLVQGLRALVAPPPVLLFCQRRQRSYGAEDVQWASTAFGGLPVVMERPPRVLYRAWAAYGTHSRMDVLVHNLHGVLPAAARGANVFIVPDLIPLTIKSGHPGYADECRDFYLRATATGDAVVVSSEHTKGELVDLTETDPDQVHVIPPAVHEEYRPLHSQERTSKLPPDLQGSPYVLCVSTLEPRKNHNVLVRAFARLLADVPSIPHRLALVGGREKGFTEPLDLARELGIADRVRHSGFVESLPAVYNAADLFVFPSVYEGFGLPPLEAMSCGVPVIASRASSVPEVVGDAGLLFDPHDHEQLAAQMRSVLTSDDMRTRLRQRSLARAAEFSWDRSAQAFTSLLKGVVASRRQPPAARGAASGANGNGVSGG